MHEQNAVGAPGTAAAGTGVLEEMVAFLVTRGWVLDYYNADYTFDSSNGLDVDWRIYKDFVCEDGSTQRATWHIEYEGATTTTDAFNLWLLDTDGTFGRQTESGVPSSNWDGTWSFWVSDTDSDSFLILRDSPAHQCIGIWPPSGSLFSQGYSSSTFPLSGGIAPIFAGSGPSFNGPANSYANTLDISLAGTSGYRTGLSRVPEKFDFTFVTDDYGRPVFRTQGGDVAMLVNYSEANDIGPYPNINVSTEVTKFGDQYYIAVGRHQKLLLNTGTIAPVF